MINLGGRISRKYTISADRRKETRILSIRSLDPYRDDPRDKNVNGIRLEELT